MSTSPLLSIPWFELPRGLEGQDAYKALDRLTREYWTLRESSFFLVRIAGNGEVMRCRRCGNQHTYLTLMCIEQPFAGLAHGLYAFWHTSGVTGAEAYLSPGARARRRAIGDMLGLNGHADLAASHPDLARKVTVDERDTVTGAIPFAATEGDPSTLALGLLEPIKPHEARRYVNAINSRGLKPPLNLPGLDPPRALAAPFRHLGR